MQKEMDTRGEFKAHDRRQLERWQGRREKKNGHNVLYTEYLQVNKADKLTCLFAVIRRNMCFIKCQSNSAVSSVFSACWYYTHESRILFCHFSQWLPTVLWSVYFHTVYSNLGVWEINYYNKVDCLGNWSISACPMIEKIEISFQTIIN